MKIYIQVKSGEPQQPRLIWKAPSTWHHPPPPSKRPRVGGGGGVIQAPRYDTPTSSQLLNVIGSPFKHPLNLTATPNSLFPRLGGT